MNLTASTLRKRPVYKEVVGSTQVVLKGCWASCEPLCGRTTLTVVTLVFTEKGSGDRERPWCI